MANNPGKWEIAGKDGKARKNTGGKKSNKTKINEADLPKLDIKAPIPESKTQYAAFSSAEKEPFAVPKQESSSDSDSHVTKSRHDGNRKMEKKHQHHKEPHLTFNDSFSEALYKCDVASVEKFISESKDKYGNNGLVLIKYLTGFLQETFSKMHLEADPVLGNLPPDFPLGELADDVDAQILDELKRLDANQFNKLFSYCLDEMLVEINKGHATYGIRIIIQYIVKCCPHVTIGNVQEYLPNVIAKKENPREALSLLWAFGQTPDHTDLEARMIAWSSFFFPLIELKHLSEYVINYLEATLCVQLPDKFTETPVSAENFQRLMEITYGSNFVKFPFRRQLQVFYPKIKAIVFTACPPNSSLAAVFFQLFDSLNNDLGKEYQQEALNCLVECLEKDATCHYKWRNHYLRLKESSLLLSALIQQWESICRSVPRKYLMETLREFQNVNSELKERERPKPILLNCESSCQTLLDRISSTPKHVSQSKPSRIYKFFKIFLLLLSVTICVDMYRHSGYQGSKTSKVLQQHGVEKVLINAYNQGVRYTQQAESWAAKRYPHYYKKVRDVVEPASDYTITKLGVGMYYIANVTAPARQYIHKTVPPLLEKFEAFVSFYFNLVLKVLIKCWNEYFPIVKRYLQRAWDTLAIWVPFAWARAQELVSRSASWVYNLSPDFFDSIADGFRQLVNEVVTKSPHILALIQEYLLTAWNLMVGFMSDAVLWVKNNVS